MMNGPGITTNMETVSTMIIHDVVLPPKVQDYFFTFGQDHLHMIDGFVYDRNVVVIINGTKYAARKRMFDLFGDKWSMCYDTMPNMSYFPGGLKRVCAGEPPQGDAPHE